VKKPPVLHVVPAREVAERKVATPPTRENSWRDLVSRLAKKPLAPR